MAASAKTTPRPGERWEITRQAAAAWRAFTWAALALLVGAALLAAGQIYTFQRMFSDMHPWLGWGFLAAATAAVIWLIALPLARFWRLPRAATPPEVVLNPETCSADVRRRLTYTRAYLRGLRANPELAPRRADVETALADLRTLRRRGAGPMEAAAFERERVAPLLGELDKTVDAYIRTEAAAVGAATAISMNGSIDAFIVLWRNVNMISRIARLYYGRPNLRASLLIVRDVAGAVVLSRALDDVADAAGDAVGGVLGKIGGGVAGPLMDGSVNALMTLKIGYVAKRRCRSFEPWTAEQKTRALTAAFNAVRQESTNVASEIARRCASMIDAAASAATAAGGAAVGHSRSAWGKVQDLFVKRPSSVPLDG